MKNKQREGKQGKRKSREKTWKKKNNFSEKKLKIPKIKLKILQNKLFNSPKKLISKYLILAVFRKITEQNNHIKMYNLFQLTHP